LVDVAGRQWPGSCDFEEGAALLDLVFDAFGERFCVGSRVVAEDDGTARGHRQSGDGEADHGIGIEQFARHAVRRLDPQQRRIVLVTQVEADRIATEHLLSLDDEEAQDFVKTAARVDHGQQVAQTFGAEAAHHVDRSRGHGRNIYREPGALLELSLKLFVVAATAVR
jgi:hypothetical protein